MLPYQNHPVIDKAIPEHLGVLLVNLGTPDAPTTADVRRYLAEFLSDTRVVETPRWLWWFILNGIILRRRPKRSAAAYASVWTEEGSPLMRISQHQVKALQQQLNGCLDQPVKVALAMRYGNPSIAAGLDQLRQSNASRVLVLPLYPQYCAATTASIFDAVTAELQQWRRIPELRFINRYHNHPAYIQALADSVRAVWQREEQPERLLMSFHGIPQDYADGGDPYPEECQITASLLAAELGLTDGQWAISFQSRMGRKPWIQPYTDKLLKAWGKEGVKRVHVICPGFAADCLETLEEVAVENRDYFLKAGGESYHYIPALNESPGHIKLMAELVQQHAWR
ncbi:MAG: ferrochelatase [Candidatus Polarisedimenticolaceae bacterium]|nr:ferrochelatase [Candidatus Polarisedimenticolaceae bacterium]